MSDQDKIFDLIDELSNNRKGNYDILDRIVDFRDKMNNLLPTGNDFRNKKLIEDKMKIFTDIIKSELDVRKSIDNSLKYEVDLRSRMNDKLEENDGLTTNVDIRKIANEIEMLVQSR